MFGGQESRLRDEVHLGDELGPGDDKILLVFASCGRGEMFPRAELA